RSGRLLGRLDHLLAGVLERSLALGRRRRLLPGVGRLLHRVLHLGAGGLGHLGVDARGVLLHPLVTGGDADLVVATGGGLVGGLVGRLVGGLVSRLGLGRLGLGRLRAAAAFILLVAGNETEAEQTGEDGREKLVLHCGLSVVVMKRGLSCP